MGIDPKNRYQYDRPRTVHYNERSSIERCNAMLKTHLTPNRVVALIATSCSLNLQ